MDTAQSLQQKIRSTKLPSDVVAKLENELSRVELLTKNSGFSLEADRLIKYIDLVTALPWYSENPDILDLKRATQILNKNHFGLEEVKERILEYLSVVILNKRQNLKPQSAAL